MSKTWKLVAISNGTCDECGAWAAINIYQKAHGCTCLECREIRPQKVYSYFNVCGYCMNKWLKTREQFDNGN